MSFLCTYQGEVGPGYVDDGAGGKTARMIERDGQQFYDWPKPWYYGCDLCGRRFDYRAYITEHRGGRPLKPWQLRQLEGYDQHRCFFCEGGIVEATQLELSFA